MGKNIVLFVDGTNNDGEKTTPEVTTNVWKLYQLCEESCKLYMGGVGSGTFDLLGGPTGFGTKERLKKAYRFLVDQYREGDHIFLFGFSRGAFAVRLFAGFLGHVGTLFGGPLYEDYLPHMYQIYEGSVALNDAARFRQYMRHFGETTPLPIHFLGVWDTVEEYWPVRDLPEIEAVPSHISHARHALALHELRGEMEPTLWTSWSASATTVKQVWFPGAHADVGGGYEDSKLAEAPLQWMTGEAQQCGLNAKTPAPNPLPQKLHQERTGNQTLGEYLSWRRGEEARKALSTVEPAQLMTSLAIHPTGCVPLVQPITDILFPPYFDEKHKTSARTKLEEVDTKTLRLLLTLKGEGEFPRWAFMLNGQDAALATPMISKFCNSPSSVPKDKLSIYITLLVLLGGDTTQLSEGLDKLDDKYLSAMEEILGDSGNKLEGLHVQVPDRLAESIASLRIRAKAEHDRRDKAETASAAKLRENLLEAKRRGWPKKPPEQ